jgi:hypothetical protein
MFIYDRLVLGYVKRDIRLACWVETLRLSLLVVCVANPER